MNKSIILQDRPHWVYCCSAFWQWFFVVMLVWGLSYVPWSQKPVFFGWSFKQDIIVVALLWAWVATLLQALRYYKTRYILREGIIHNMSGGLFFRRDQYIPINRLESLEVTQGLWARLLGYGNLIYHLRGGNTITVKHLSRPEKWLESIEFIRY